MGTLQRIKQFIDFKGVTNKMFEKNIGFSNGAFASQLKRNRTIGVDKIENILSFYPEINPEWLLTGKGEMLKENKVAEEPSFKVIEINPESKSNTLIADVKASAGFGNFIDNPKQLEELPAISLPNAPFGLNVAFQIEGDSMHPTIRHLDYVAANQLNSLKDIRDGYTYIIIDKDDGVLCKRLYKEGADFKIVSDNPNYTPYKRSPYDIIAVFKCFMRLSTDFRTYHDDVRKAIQDLRLKYDSLERRLNK